jgi:hypothetical protein
MSLASGRTQDRLVLGCLLVVALVVRSAGVVFVRGVVAADVSQFYGWGVDIERGRSPYIVHRCNLPPTVAFMSVLLRAAARETGITFDVLFKVPGIAADLAVVALLYTTLLRTRGRSIATLAAAGYAVNPVAVIISSFHGQIDGIAILCCVAAVLLLERPREPGFETLSALCLGAGIALKDWPVLLLPIVLVHLGGSLRRRATYVALACLPAAGTLLPFFLHAPRAVLSGVIGYGGATDHGWVAALRSFRFARTGDPYLPGNLGETLNRWGKIAFLGLYLVSLPLGRRRWSLAGHCAATFLLFYVVFGGLSSQYLLWLIPFGLLGLELMTVPYTLSATATLVPFYLRFFPEVLLGQHPPPVLSPGTLALTHAFATAAWWLTSLVWLLTLLLRWSRRHGPREGNARDRGGASSFGWSLVPGPHASATDAIPRDARPPTTVKPGEQSLTVSRAAGRRRVALGVGHPVARPPAFTVPLLASVRAGAPSAKGNRPRRAA